MIAKGDVASLRQNAIPSLAADFSGVEGTVKENQAALAGSKGTARPPFFWKRTEQPRFRTRNFFAGYSAATDRPRTAPIFAQQSAAGKIWRGDSRRAFRQGRVHGFADPAADRHGLEIRRALYQSLRRLAAMTATGSWRGRGNIRAKARRTMHGSIIWWRARWYRLCRS